jgi:DNA invertase Pin-like site-specific DNA recombinase
MSDQVLARRCAIYVRKSSEEGLDMSYNSLEAQRDACAAYIASQRHEGWVKLSKTYEDGGYSGGTMDRPGLQQLLSDVEAGKIDIIVVYKIDRLTRSLTDFARLNEVLDKHNVSFVAVTQQFNTSTSMGRLTLNVLLSFAQFEREVAGERIRDKVAASKKKGMWMGGPVPLGYAVKDRKLVMVPEEADVVRHIFARYLELRSVRLLQQELEQQGIRSRPRIMKSGRMLGGIPLGRGALGCMLKNPLYVGLIRHQNEMHAGQHEAIIDRPLFDAVQAALAQQGPAESARQKRSTVALLKGIAFDDAGRRLLPTFCSRNGRRYHYYTSDRRKAGAAHDQPALRIPAHDLERMVMAAVADRLRDNNMMRQWLEGQVMVGDLPDILKTSQDLASILTSNVPQEAITTQSLLSRVVVSKSVIVIQLSASGLRQALGIDTKGKRQHEAPAHAADEDSDSRRKAIDPLTIIITSHLLRCGKQVKLVLGHEPNQPAKVNQQLVEIIARARRWFEGLTLAKYLTLSAIAQEEDCDKSHVSRQLSLAFLAPDIVEQVLTGNHSPTLTPERLRKACPLPLRWDEQRALLLD